MNRLDNHQPLSTHNIYFAKIDSISQTFISHRANLNIVSICLRNPNRLLIPLRFELYDDDGGVVRSLDFTGGNIDNFDCTKFQFDPISSSKDKKYTAQIHSVIDPLLDPQEKAAVQSGIYVESHGGGDYIGGNAYINGADSGYDLHFKTFYRQDIQTVFKESYMSFSYRVMQDRAFIIAFLIILSFIFFKHHRAK